MSIVVIGLNHTTVPLDLLGRMTIADEALPKALHDLASRPHVSEAVVLSTCNRIEVYAVAEKFHGAYQDIRNGLSELSHEPPESFSHHLYTHYGRDAADHLFTVASGLDSVVVGEHEILGQVRSAVEVARAEGTAGSGLELLFRHAIETGKRARTDTSISRHIASVSHAAVAMAAERLGGLRNRRMLVLGAGDMGRGMVTMLSEAGAAEIAVANRTYERSVELAGRVGGVPVRLLDVPERLSEVDVLLTSTGASSIMLDHGDLAPAIRRRNGRPLLIVDVAVPRDIDPAVAGLDGVTLLDMDDIRAFAAAGLAARRKEVSRVRSIVAEEVDRYLDASAARQVAPIITEIRNAAETLRQGELDRFRSKLEGLTPDQAAAVDALTRGLVNKVLHEPTVQVRDAAGTPRGERLAEALRDLFDI